MGCLQPGFTGWPRHEHDYVVVPLFDGDLRIDTGTGDDQLSNYGGSYFGQAGVSMMRNCNEVACSFIS